MYPITYLYLYLGYILGENWEQAGAIFDQYAFPVAGVIVVVITGYIIYKQVVSKKNKVNSQID